MKLAFWMGGGRWGRGLRGSRREGYRWSHDEEESERAAVRPWPTAALTLCSLRYASQVSSALGYGHMTGEDEPGALASELSHSIFPARWPCRPRPCLQAAASRLQTPWSASSVRYVS